MTRFSHRIGSLLLSAALFGSLGACSGRVINPNGTPGAPDDPTAALCTPGEIPAVATAPIRRLTTREYRNTVTDLFPGVALPALGLVVDPGAGGFSNNELGQAVTPVGVEAFTTAAETIGTMAASDLAQWAPCTDSTAACARDIALSLLPRAYRRPPTEAERTRVADFVDSAFAEWGFEDAVRLTVAGLLQSPSFLYRPEFGGGGDGAAVPLTDHELASRLSYFLWQTMPDAELTAAAAAGDLATEAGLAAQVERMLADSRARHSIANFFDEWFQIAQVETLALDRDAFPELDDDMRYALADSLRLYVEKAFWDDDSLDSLFAGTYGYVNDRLAPLFGVAAPGSDDLVLVELDPGQRRGLLTQPGFLASTSHGIAHSPIFRGVALLEHVLCAPPPAPPPGILDELEDIEIEGDVCTTRDQVAKTHTSRAECQGCHEFIDGAGFAFENYDALGRFRTEENGCSVDATGSFPGTDIAGETLDGVEAAIALSQSEQVAECVTRHWFRFALGRTEQTTDTCQVQELTRIARESGGSLQTIVVELIRSPTFRNRPAN